MSRTQGPRHFVIPDLQVKPGVRTDHLLWLARHAAEKRPDVIAQVGDWADMPSLSSWDRGKMSSEGRRYVEDIEATNASINLFEKELAKRAKGYKPRKFITLGNHEDRIRRAVEEDARLEGNLSADDIVWKENGWVVVPFLRPHLVHGVTYMHYCPLNAKGKVTNGKKGCPSAEAQARRMMRSTVCGHAQGLDTSIVHTPGRTVRGVIAGSCYLHEEEYLTPVGETYWRGALMLNDVQEKTGEFDVCEISLAWLERRYG
jgi:hypothetical protein